MKCAICREGEPQPGKTTVTLERKGLTLVMKGVPAMICRECGEEFVAAEVKDRLLHQAEETARGGVQIAICEYLPG